MNGMYLEGWQMEELKDGCDWLLLLLGRVPVNRPWKAYMVRKMSLSKRSTSVSKRKASLSIRSGEVFDSGERAFARETNPEQCWRIRSVLVQYRVFVGAALEW